MSGRVPRFLWSGERQRNSPPSSLRSIPSSTRPGRARNAVLGTNPHSQTPEVSPYSRRMELRKVPSSSSGSPVLEQRSRGTGNGKRGGHSQIPLRQPSFRRPVCPESAVGKEQAWAPTEFRGPREAFLRAPVSTSRGKDWEWVGRATKGIEGRLPRDCLFQLDDLGQVILPPCASVFSSVKRG